MNIYNNIKDINSMKINLSEQDIMFEMSNPIPKSTGLVKYDFISEYQEELINSGNIYEVSMKGDRMSDKFGDLVGSVVDNLVCICMYPDIQNISIWKERTCGLCKRFIEINIEPQENNTPNIRRKHLAAGVFEELDEDYGAVLNHFKNIYIYYTKYGDMTPCSSYEECYKENKELIEDCINSIINYVAKQDYKGLTECIESVK